MTLNGLIFLNENGLNGWNIERILFHTTLLMGGFDWYLVTGKVASYCLKAMITQSSGARLTNVFLPAIQIWWKLRLVATNFCTCHDSTAVVSCTKFCSDHCIRIEVSVKRNFHRIWIAMEKPLVKWAPDPYIHYYAKKTNYLTWLFLHESSLKTSMQTFWYDVTSYSSSQSKSWLICSSLHAYSLPMGCQQL